MSRRKAEQMIRGEFIGCDVEIVRSSNRSLIGMRGKVIDETKNTFSIETEKGRKRVIKEICSFLFTLHSGERVEIEGELLVGRPEDRIKKKLKARRRW